MGSRSPSKLNQTAQNTFFSQNKPNQTLTNGQVIGQLARMATTGTTFFDKQKQDAQAERLIHSVNAVTELLKANTQLRDQIEKTERDLD